MPYEDDNNVTLQHEMEVAVKANHDGHLDKEDCAFLTKQGYYYPSDAKELEIQLETYLKIIEILFGSHSHICYRLSSWLKHISDNWTSYTSQQGKTGYWCCKVAFAIDNAIQLHLHRLKDTSLPLHEVGDFYI